MEKRVPVLLVRILDAKRRKTATKPGMECTDAAHSGRFTFASQCGTCADHRACADQVQHATSLRMDGWFPDSDERSGFLPHPHRAASAIWQEMSVALGPFFLFLQDCRRLAVQRGKLIKVCLARQNNKPRATTSPTTLLSGERTRWQTLFVYTLRAAATVCNFRAYYISGRIRAWSFFL